MWLTISSRNQSPRSLRPSSRAYLIGRARDCDLAIDDEHVSGHHARLEVQPSGAWLSDLDSTNGTFVGRRRIVGSTWLPVESEFTVGTTIVRLSGEHPTTAAPTYAVRNAGPVAGHDVSMNGQHVAGRDLVYHEGLKLRSRMRSSAKNCIRLGCVLHLGGMGLVGYFVLVWNQFIFGALEESTPPSDLPSPLPWVPLGATLAFAGVVLIVVGLLIPRDLISPPRRR